MADNKVSNPGAGGATFATDDIGGVDWPFAKLAWGPRDTANEVDDATGKRFPVKVGDPLPTGGNTIGAVTGSGVFHIDDNAGSITVDGTVSIGANQSVNVNQIAGTATDVAHGAAGSGTQRVIIASDQDTLNVFPTNISTDNLYVHADGIEARDAVLTRPPQVAGARASTATPSSVSADGDVVDIWANRNGALRIDPIGTTTQPISGTVTVNQPVAVTDNAGSLTVDAPVATPVFVRLSDGGAAITALPVTDNAGSLTVDSTQLPAALVGGRLDENIGAWLGSTAPTVGSKTSANSVPVVIASDQAAVAVTGTLTAVTTITNVVHVDDNAGSLTVDGTVAVSSIGGTVTVAGNKTNNNAAPGATNVGTLPGVATAAAPTYVEGNQVALSTDLTGALRVSGGGVSVTEDVQSTGAESLSMAGVIRNDIPVIDQNRDGDYAALKANQYGALRTKDSDAEESKDYMRRIAEAVEGLSSSATGLPIPTQYSVTNPLPVTIEATIPGGPNTFELVSAATANSTLVKSLTGTLFGWLIYNTNAAARYVKLYDSATSPTAGTKPKLSILIPGASAGAGNNFESGIGIPFVNGISFVTVTGAADSDATSVGANDLIINLLYL